MIFESKINEIGFTLVEVMFSLLLVSLAMLFLMKVTVQVFHLNRQSTIRFYMNHRLTAKKNQLMSKPFDSSSLVSGKYKEAAKGYELNWVIVDIDSTLKKITVSLRWEKQILKVFLYKSKYIKEVYGE